MTGTRQTQAFYDSYWPQNVPDYSRTREHVLSLLPPGDYARALDAGCGTGVCSLALAERSEKVVSLDISNGSLHTAIGLAAQTAKSNIRFLQGSLLDIPLLDGSFDLAFSWGVIHHTVDPARALDELVRVLKPDGALILAVYLKTNLTFAHEATRKIALRFGPFLRRVFIQSLAAIVRLRDRFYLPELPRNDSGIEALIEDWFFVPEKHFFSVEEMRQHFAARGLSFELCYASTARFKSTSNFICRGRREKGV